MGKIIFENYKHFKVFETMLAYNTTSIWMCVDFDGDIAFYHYI